MFTTEDRARIRSQLLDVAREDSRIAAAAITGSAAAGCEDEFSDIDLAFGVRDPEELSGVLSDWTARMYEAYGAAHHIDFSVGVWIYRAFLLANTLQVDLAFVPASAFGAIGPAFQLIFGNARDAEIPAAAPEQIAGLAWLHAVHARSCIARGRLWQAEYMIAGVRNHALALACLRYGLPAVHGRGMDQLPEEAKAPFAESLVRSFDAIEISRAFRAAMAGLVRELARMDGDAGKWLARVLRELAPDSQ